MWRCVFFFFRSIVDDSEMYEQQKPFRLNELVRISAFLNNLVFKMLWNEMVDGTYVMIWRLILRLLSSNPIKARALRKFSENCMLSWLSDTRIRPKRRIDILAYFLLPIVNICSSFLSYIPLEKIHFPSYLLPVKRIFFSNPVIFVWLIFRNQRTDVKLSSHVVDDTVRQRLQTNFHLSRSLAC